MSAVTTSLDTIYQFTQAAESDETYTQMLQPRQAANPACLLHPLTQGPPMPDERRGGATARLGPFTGYMPL